MTRQGLAETNEAGGDETGTSKGRTDKAAAGDESLVAVAVREGVPEQADVGKEIRCRVRVAGATVRATLVDKVPKGWPVRPVRATELDPGQGAVVLGEVSPDNLGGGQVFEYRVTVPDSAVTGARYTLGPTEAVATVDGEWVSGTVASAAGFTVGD